MSLAAHNTVFCLLLLRISKREMSSALLIDTPWACMWEGLCLLPLSLRNTHRLQCHRQLWLMTNLQLPALSGLLSSPSFV